jgi:hypothetical protein
MRRLALAGVLALAVLGVLAGSSSARTDAACIYNKQAGVKIVNHTAVIVYCGSAKLTITSNGKTTHYRGGACYPVAGSLSVGMGKFTPLGRTPLYSAVLFVVPGDKDGTYRLGVITVENKGQKIKAANQIKAVLTGKRTKGTFSGKFPQGAKFTGSFTCK